MPEKIVKQALSEQIYNILKENILDKMPKKIIVTGGGANSPVVQQTLADLFEAQILLTDVSDIVGSLGAAVAAGYGVGIYKDMQQARKIEDQQKLSPLQEHYHADDENAGKIESRMENLKSVQ